jgi:hypothetical protein
LLPSIVLLCRASYTLGYLPKAWRGVKVVYIPKAETKDSEQPKLYRPISLTSFLLKTMDKADIPAHKVVVPSKAPSA